jgi:uncharacterized protein (TIGR02145 family)
MNTLKLIALSIIAILFASCKASQPTGPPSGSTPSLLKVAQTLDSTQSKFFAYSKLNSGNPGLSMIQTAAWLQSQPNVQTVAVPDSLTIAIVLKSGLSCRFVFDEVDSAGLSTSRGGKPDPGGPTLSFSRDGTLSTSTITNKNVLFYIPVYNQFYTPAELQQQEDYFNNSPLGFNVTALTNSACAYKSVESFGNYGLVLIYTHGQPDGFLSGNVISVGDRDSSDNLFKADIVAQGGQDMLDKLISGELIFYWQVRDAPLGLYWQKSPSSTLYVAITSKYLEALPQMPGTVIVGSMCYGGSGAHADPAFYEPIRTAIMNRDPISYYCYARDDGTSAPISGAFAKRMEDSLIHALVVDIDSTKIANLQPDGQTEYSAPQYAGTDSMMYFRHFGADNYSYPPPCPDSFIDARDGTVYKVVCIGNQTWMAQNLDYYPSGTGYACYNDDAGNCATYGLLYDWNTMMQGADSTSANPSKVQGICPHGWHVPSDAEFQQLFAAIGSNAAGAMKSTSGLWASTNVGATNASGFSALPGGYAFNLKNVTSTSLELGSVAMFGTTTNTPQSGTNPSWNLWGLWNYSASPSPSPGDIVNSGNSCRCVKDP